MKSAAEPFKFVDAASLNAAYTQPIPYDAVAYFGLSLQYIVTGAAPTGSLVLEMSNDKLNWTAVPTDTVHAVNPVALTAATTGFWRYFTMQPTKWLRVKYTFTSGTGAVTVWGCGVRLG